VAGRLQWSCSSSRRKGKRSIAHPGLAHSGGTKAGMAGQRRRDCGREVAVLVLGGGAHRGNALQAALGGGVQRRGGAAAVVVQAPHEGGREHRRHLLRPVPRIALHISSGVCKLHWAAGRTQAKSGNLHAILQTPATLAYITAPVTDPYPLDMHAHLRWGSRMVNSWKPRYLRSLEEANRSPSTTVCQNASSCPGRAGCVEPLPPATFIRTTAMIGICQIFAVSALSCLRK